MLRQSVISLLKKTKTDKAITFLLFAEVDFKRAKNLWSSLMLGKSRAGQVELEGEGDAGMEREREGERAEMGDRGVERGSPLISGRSER